jgi:ABC-type polysaccharide/polyol phosphate transport system ATPase subunit
LPTLPDGSVQVEQVWKKFRADRTVPKFYDQMKRFGNSIGQRSRHEYRWVLKDVNMEVPPGGTMALIGINGSGKTTLLKIISQVTYQSAGRCDVQGRIGALLSVTSGIQPELSGRENVFLYGAVLGMGRQVIRQRFDEIVEFAGLSDAIDRQVKFYSMGMQMRLGFSIAAFLEPDVLLVDEVLSVGDATFQQKCLNRIGEVVRQGTTLLYVSHDLASVEASCERALWLADAVVLASGPTKEVVSKYRSAVEQNAALATSTEGVVQVLKADIRAADGGQIRSECDLDICLTLNSPEAHDANFFIGVSQGTAFPMFIVRYSGSFPAGDFEVRCRLRNVPLAHGRYSLWPAMSGHLKGKGKPLLAWRPVTSFDVMGPDLPKLPEGVMVLSPVYVGADWQVN